MYKVLIVDDETPALRYLQTIVEKYAPSYEIASCCTSGEEALARLQKEHIDLLLTDISMPAMDGIALSLEARQMQPDIHIIIVTGYADFEYAKGAIQASVDDYILKPVSVSQMKDALDKLRLRMDEEQAARIPTTLSAMFNGQSYDEAILSRLFGAGRFHFALLRWGNLGVSRGPLKATSVVPAEDLPFHILYGRDEDEQLLFMPSSTSAQEFQAQAKHYAQQYRSASTMTLLFSRNAGLLSSLPDFFTRAAEVMEYTVSIGAQQCGFLSGGPAPDLTRHLSNATLKRLEHFITDCNTRMIKDAFVALAIDWGRERLPQMFAAAMVQQLVHLVLTARPVSGKQQDAIAREVRELLISASTYGDLMASLYSVLFDKGAIKDKKLTTEDLYQYAIAYINENYSKAISIQNVCTEIGISQTYLSRLFRKHGNTSFSTYLTQCRLNAAMELIRQHPDMALRNVASCVGYEDYAYFSKVFHQSMGCTPSQWATQMTGE